MDTMKAHIFIMGCKVELETASSHMVLDPCNCSTYFKLKPDAVPLTKELYVCDAGLLWNHKISECQLKSAVVQDGVCDPKKPWQRCVDSSGTVEHMCISEGLFNMSTSAAVSVTLSPSAQQANLELALTAMIAGSIITLMLVAIIWTFCNRQTIRIPQNLWKLFKDRQKKEKREKPVPMTTEGDNVSVVYEDIDEEEDGYMAPEVRGSALPNQPAPPDTLPDNKPTPHPPRKPPHTPILKKAGPTTDEITESETVGQGTAIRNALQPKIQHAEGSGLRMVPKPTGSSPKVPQKPPKSPKRPKDTITPASPLVPHRKVTKTLTEDEGYIHAVSP